MDFVWQKQQNIRYKLSSIEYMPYKPFCVEKIRKYSTQICTLFVHKIPDILVDFLVK
jgi:hypothetical protein